MMMMMMMMMMSSFLGFRRPAGSTSLEPSVVDKISLSEMYIDDPDRDYYTLVPLGSFRLRHDVTFGFVESIPRLWDAS